MTLGAKELYRELKAALDPALSARGYRRRARTAVPLWWSKPFDDESELGVQLGSTDRVGGSFFGYLELYRPRDQTPLKQEFVTRHLTKEEVGRLAAIHEGLRGRHPDVPPLVQPPPPSRWFKKAEPAPHGLPSLLYFYYRDAADVALWTAFLSPLLPELLDRFRAGLPR